MTTEQAKQLSEDALNRLLLALERGHSDAYKNYLAVMFHRYSFTSSTDKAAATFPKLLAVQHYDPAKTTSRSQRSTGTRASSRCISA